MPVVEQSLGGGAPRSVQFVLRLDEHGGIVPSPLSVDEGADLPVTVDPKEMPGSKLSRLYALIFESESDYFVAVEGEHTQHTLKLPKTAVQGIIYLTPHDEFLLPSDAPSKQ